MLTSLFAAGVFDENTAHCFSSRCKEMAATAPVLGFCADQANIGFMNESGCLKCLTRQFLRHLQASQTTQLLIN
jgi:hypothetical protein